MPSVDGRYCPKCERPMEAAWCPHHGIRTEACGSASGGGYRPLLPGTVIAERYRIEALLDSGGMGSVYVATQLAVERRVALKVLPREVLHDGSELRRFHHEAKSASRLMHPNVVRVHDYGIDGRTEMPYIAMELVRGETLRRILMDQGAVEVSRACRIFEQVSRALVAAHEAGLVHRDLKPDNIMVTLLSEDDEHVSVLDFGIAKAVEVPMGVAERLTGSGVVMGTPRYMSPEQARGWGLDGRSDLYSLGCVLHEVLTGRAAFTAHDAESLMLRHVNAIRPVLPDLDTDPDTLNTLRVLHGLLLCKRPEGRPLSAARVGRVFRRLAQGRPPKDVLGMLLDSDCPQGSDGLAPGGSDPEDEPISWGMHGLNRALGSRTVNRLATSAAPESEEASHPFHPTSPTIHEPSAPTRVVKGRLSLRAIVLVGLLASGLIAAIGAYLGSREPSPAAEGPAPAPRPEPLCSEVQDS